MKKNVVDMGRVRKALSELDRLAAEHPELCSPSGPRWADNLDELDKLTLLRSIALVMLGATAVWALEMPDRVRPVGNSTQGKAGTRRDRFGKTRYKKMGGRP